MALLDTELRTSDQHRDRLIGSAEGTFALVRGDEIVGIYDSKMDAVAAGYPRFGTVAFLVKQIVRIDPPQHFASNILGR